MAWTTGGTLIEKINEAMDHNDFQIAEDLLKDFKDKIDSKFFDFIQETRKIQYQNQVIAFNKRKTLHEFNIALTNYDLKTAKEKLEALTSQKLILTKEKSHLESNLFLITEDGLLSLIRSASPSEEKISLMEKYADVYSQGREIRRIGTDLIAESFARVINAVNALTRFEDLYNQTHRITNYLEKYAQRGMNLSQIVPLTDFLKTVQDYLIQLKSRGPSVKPLEVGSVVRYVREIFRIGTGEEIRVNPEINFGVEGIVTSCEYGNTSYYTVTITQKKLKNNSSNKEEHLEEITEGLFGDELEIREPITEIDRNLVKNELNRIEKLFREHYSTEVKEQYKSQDFPNGINTLVSN